MTELSTHQCGFWEADPKKWERCLFQAQTEMIAEGWETHSRKFLMVQYKRAKKLWEMT